METWFLLPFASEEKGLGDEVKETGWFNGNILNI
jgi:hypothetical protein